MPKKILLHKVISFTLNDTLWNYVENPMNVIGRWRIPWDTAGASLVVIQFGEIKKFGMIIKCFRAIQRRVADTLENQYFNNHLLVTVNRRRASPTN